MEKKKKLDYYTKSKLLIQGEYLLIAIVFLVLAILRLVGVISIKILVVAEERGEG